MRWGCADPENLGHRSQFSLPARPAPTPLPLPSPPTPRLRCRCWWSGTPRASCWRGACAWRLRRWTRNRPPGHRRPGPTLGIRELSQEGRRGPNLGRASRAHRGGRAWRLWTGSPRRCARLEPGTLRSSPWWVLWGPLLTLCRSPPPPHPPSHPGIFFDESIAIAMNRRFWASGAAMVSGFAKSGPRRISPCRNGRSRPHRDPRGPCGASGPP